MRRVKNITPVLPFKVGDLSPHGDTVSRVERCKHTSICSDDYYRKMCGECQISINNRDDMLCGFYMVKNR